MMWTPSYILLIQSKVRLLSLIVIGCPIFEVDQEAPTLCDWWVLMQCGFCCLTPPSKSHGVLLTHVKCGSTILQSSFNLFEMLLLILIVDSELKKLSALKALQASDPARFQNFMQALNFHYQALASGLAQHAEQRRIEIEKEKVEKAAASAATTATL